MQRAIEYSVFCILYSCFKENYIKIAIYGLTTGYAIIQIPNVMYIQVVENLRVNKNEVSIVILRSKPYLCWDAKGLSKAEPEATVAMR